MLCSACRWCRVLVNRKKIHKSGARRARRDSSKRQNTKSHSMLPRRKDITLNDRLVLYLNSALSLENAAIERLQARIRQTKLADSKVQLQHHLEETKEQQVRLRSLISNLGGKPTRDKGSLPIASSSKSIESLLKKHMTNIEVELRGAKDDAVIESGEIVLYDVLIQLAQKAATTVGGDAIPVLTQSLSEERAMMDWIKANNPVLITQLWPDISSPTVETKTIEPSLGEDQIQQ
jgi:ferritin-like metal-binding protein YciE